MTTYPLTTTSCAALIWKVSPTFAEADETVSVTIKVMGVPPGTTTFFPAADAGCMDARATDNTRHTTKNALFLTASLLTITTGGHQTRRRTHRHHPFNNGVFPSTRFPSE